MNEFDAKAARAKRPIPFWVDDMARETALLETDEFGAYIKILMAMWVARDVALPDEPRKLARAAGVSLRLWNARIGTALEGFWSACPEGLTHEALRKEATYAERQVQSQSNRKRAEKSDKSLKNNDPESSADTSTDPPADTSTEQPTQIPNYLRRRFADDDDADARARPSLADDRRMVLDALGIDGDGIGPNGAVICNRGDMVHLDAWRNQLGLSDDQIVDVIKTVMARRSEPPNRLKYFDRPMAERAGQLQRPNLTPIQGGRSNGTSSTSKDPHAQAMLGLAESFRDVIALQRRGRGGPDDSA